LNRFDEIRDRLSRLGVILTTQPGQYCLQLYRGSNAAFLTDSLDEALAQGLALAERARKQPKLLPMGPLGTPTSRGKRIAHNRKLWRKRAAESGPTSKNAIATPYGPRSIAWLQSDAFLESREWKDFRYSVLKERKPVCELCGATRKDGTIIQVDHIKPRSKFPHLALDQGKSYTDETDWRT
jgi:5-methylcytosine-specific restriction endonuclease McrA